MAALLTTAGIAHLAELDATWPSPVTTEAMDALIFGAGNATPDVADTQAEVTQPLAILVRVAAGYPVLGDTNPQNVGRAPDWYTWKFVVPSGNPLVASNVALTNWNGGVQSGAQAVGVHEKILKYSKFDSSLVVFVNAKTGEVPTIYSAEEVSIVNRAVRSQTWTARARMLFATPGGVRLAASRLSARPPKGHPVATAALFDGCLGGTMRCDEVASVTLTERRWRGDRDIWVSRTSNLRPGDVVPSAVVSGDPRWPNIEYNFAHVWSPPSRSEESTWELFYELRLTDGTSRTIVVEVRVG